MSDWTIFTKDGEPHDGILRLPPPPPWRDFRRTSSAGDRGGRAATYRPNDDEVQMVNAALYLRRPLLVTGKPGTGKSSLAYAVARQLGLGRVLVWPVSSKTTLQDGLYQYDAIGRLQAKGLGREADVSAFMRLGPLGTALLPSDKPRVLLVDEIDKSDIDLPNDLLNVMEEGRFEIPELRRFPSPTGKDTILDHDGVERTIEGGVVQASSFPFMLATSNGEREFPPAFLRRCLRLSIKQPDRDQLLRIAEAHLQGESGDYAPAIDRFLAERQTAELATDQLLNVLYMIAGRVGIENDEERKGLEARLLQSLSGSGAE